MNNTLVNKRNIWAVIIKWIFIVMLCTISAFIVEKYVFCAKQLAGEGIQVQFDLNSLNSEGFKYENGTLVSTSTDAKLILPIGGYVDDLRISYFSDESFSIGWDREDYSDSELDNTLPEAGLIDSRNHVADRKIGLYTDQLYVFLRNISEPITITDILLKSTYVFHWQRFILIAAMLLGLAIPILGYRSLQKKPEKMVAIVGALLGMGMLFAIPYEKNSWDDEIHFANAYQMSYTLSGQDTQWTQSANEFVDADLPASQSYNERLLLKQHLDEAGSIETDLEKNKGFSYFFNKVDSLPTAVGILLGRLLCDNFSDWFVGARIANLIFYIFIIYFAVKIMPIGKSLLAFLALLPTPIFLTVSYSTDFFMNSLLMLAAALFFREMFSPEQKIYTKNVAVYVLAMMFGCSRKMIYIPLILMGFLLPDSKFEDKKRKWIYRGILIAACFLEMLIVALSASGLTDERGGETSVSGQMSYIMHKPITFAVMLGKTIARESIEYIMDGQAKLSFNLSGQAVGTVELVTVISLVILILYARGKDERFQIGWKKTVLGYALIAVVICFIWGSMYLSYTPVGADIIAGVQPRYYIPLLPYIFMLLPIRRIKFDISERVMLLFSLLLVVGINFISIYKILIQV